MHSSSTIFFALAAMVASVYAGGIPLAPIAVAAPVAVHYPADIVVRESYPAYKSSYAVSDAITGDHKSAVEIRDGDVTKGSYSLLQPDGVVRTVNYIVTPLGGFQAQVINTGTGVHPGTLAKAIIGVASPLTPIIAPVAPVFAGAPLVAAGGAPLSVATRFARASKTVG